jgi:hypothetical protein
VTVELRGDDFCAGEWWESTFYTYDCVGAFLASVDPFDFEFGGSVLG